jgi:hypothetical protein
MQKGVKPFDVFLYLLAVFIVLFMISLVFPPEGIDIGANIRLYFKTRDDILDKQQPEYADISHLLEPVHTEFDTIRQIIDDTLAVPSEFPGGMQDAPVEGEEYQPENLADHTGVLAADESEIKGLIFPLQFPPGNDTVLDRFYSELAALEKIGGSLRIIHYGDSQIENNRISSALRRRFQAKFGGTGTGLFPVISPAPHSASIKVIPEGNWKRITPLGNYTVNANDNRYGLLMSWSEIEAKADGTAEGSFTIEPTGLGSWRSRRMDELSLIFGFNDGPFTLELRRSGKTIDAELYFPEDVLKTIKWALDGESDRYSLHFAGKGSPRIFSVSIDNSSGVAIDNVPLRGSSGTEFTRTDPEIMRQMTGKLNVRLILLQFGINVVPHIVDDYTYYENQLVRQLDFFRSVDPDIPVIVVGVSDMSRRVPGGHFESYPNVELIRDAQRNAAFRAGALFWDLYEAMGGRNSMPAWVAASPPLAQLDYAHFTFRGSDLIGEMLYNAILSGYSDYRDPSPD